MKASSNQFTAEKIAHRSFIPGDRFDVHQLTGKGNDIHARQDILLTGSSGLSDAYFRIARRDVACNVSGSGKTHAAMLFRFAPR